MRIRPLEGDAKTRTLVFSFDRKYAPYFSVTLLSLAASAEAGWRYDVVVLHDGLTSADMAVLRGIVPAEIVLRFFDARESAKAFLGDLEPKTGSGNWAAATFYDMLVPLLMPDYERVLYCDSDLVFLSDPGEIFDLPFEGNQLLAARDGLFLAAPYHSGNEFVQRQIRFIQSEIGLTDLGAYFNSGVMLFNIPAIDRDGYRERVRQALAFHDLPTVDQDALNYVFRGRVKRMPLRFNLQAHLLYDLRDRENPTPDEAEFLDAARDPVVIHYTTFEKPWKHPEVPLAEQFWRFARRSPWYERILYENIPRPRFITSGFSLKAYLRAAILSKIAVGKTRERARKAYEDEKQRL